ncbi:receptor-type tyrosine-protein phosphatase C isoform X2 [Clupea harengus]|uniref:Receptor-type tyrosine-protein phosphatase C n=1 Tax=Clupea harengus TaxID=7950 RepID=A0A8M1KQA0_CLUHA|nr:receptor-type tyrosine-protein phosphatase C isoform X2 [Clupea harengus]
MARLSGLKALLALATLIGSTQHAVAQDASTAAAPTADLPASNASNASPTIDANDNLTECPDREFSIPKNFNFTVTITISEKDLHGTTSGPIAPTNITNATTPSIPPAIVHHYMVVFNNNDSDPLNSNFSGSSFTITNLQPCTHYSFNVFPIPHNNTTRCRLKGPTTFVTRNITEGDVTPIWNDSAEEMCYKTTWEPVEKLCFKENGTCVVRSFDPAPHCGFIIQQHVPIVDSIKLKYINKTYPIEIEWENKPSECQNKNLTFNCRGPDGISYTDGKLKPFEVYNCIATYSNSNFTLQAQETVSTECDVKVEIPHIIATSTSLTLQRNSTFGGCTGVNFTFETTCGEFKDDKSNNQNDTIKFSGLKPYTPYTCKVTMKYNDEILKSVTEKNRTSADHPAPPTIIHIRNRPSNNALHVTCKNGTWNGGKGKFHATIYYTGSIVRNEPQIEDKCDFKFEDLSYSTQYTIEVKAVNADHKSSNPIKESMYTSYNDKAVIGILAFFIILTTIALLCVLYKIYILQKKKDNDNNEEEIPLSTNPLMTVEPIAADNLLDAYKKKIADEGRLFLAEFQSIPRIFSNYTVKEAKNPDNQAKNRYVDILPYDYNRVQLSGAGGGVEAGGDYINASFIEGFKEPKKYIAAQGPKEETILHFWRMIWEQKSSIIVMVTRCEEGNRNKCAQYWPSMERETEIYEDFVLKIKKEELCPDYIIRHLTIINLKDKSTEREVTHIQFTSWPDHGVPSEPHLLLKLRRRVNSFSNFFSGPIVVHCSAGVGRTGTYIGIDAMMESLNAEGVMDIYGYVVKMRRQRCLMVQVEAQYILIHQALIEFNQFGDTEVPLTELHSSITTLQAKDLDEPTLMEGEFQRLPKYRNWRTLNTAITEENKKKNRYSTFIPYDFNRVLVKLEEESSRESDQDDDDDDYSSDDDEEESTQYINASYIDGYWSPRSLIAAQGPLAGTIPEFWQMVYQKKVKNIVMLSKCKEGDQELCAEYWGQEKKTYKDISVEDTASVTSPAYIKRTIQLQHAKRKDARKVQQYHFQSWPEEGLPQNPQDLVDMIKSIKQSIGSSRADRSVPVVVHCQNGTTRSGIFCALWNLLESANTENLVDIFQVCKSLRKERQGMISDFEHYQFLHQAVGGAFPAQNGEVRQTSASPTDSVQIVNEVPASTTTVDQQVAESAPAPLQVEQAESKDDAEMEKEADAAESSTLLPAGGVSEVGEAAAQPSTANGPTITLEV